MARAAADAGIEALAATPHLRADFPGVRVEEVAERCESLGLAIRNDNIPLRVIAGAETSLAWALEADDEHLKLASYQQRGTDLLIETPVGTVAGLDRLLYSVQSRGFRVTLAHPERCPQFHRDHGPLGGLAAQGVLLQVNADSLLVVHRRSPVRRLAERLCRDGIAHVLSSDGHRAASWRPVTRLVQGIEAASTLIGPERAAWMGQAAPAAIIEGRPLPDPPAITNAPRGSKMFRRR